MKSHFHRLVVGLCSGNAELDAQQVSQGAPIELDGVAMSLAHDDLRDSQGMLVYVDFGLVPDDEKKDIYFTLLEENFIFSALRPASFSISPATGRIVYAQRIPLPGLNAQQLGQSLATLSRRARQWRLAHIASELPEAFHGSRLSPRSQPFR